MARTNNTLAVTTINGNSITTLDKALQPELQKAVKGLQTMNKGSWEYAKAISKIGANGLYKKDFENIRLFAEYIGVSAGFISQCTKAVKFASEHKGIETVYTVGKAYELSKVDNLQSLIDYASENDIPLNTDKDVQKAVKEYNGKDTDKTTGKKTKDPTIVTFELYGITYAIPSHVLKKYAVK